MLWNLQIATDDWKLNSKHRFNAAVFTARLTIACVHSSTHDTVEISKASFTQDICKPECEQKYDPVGYTLEFADHITSSTRHTKQIFRSLLICRVLVNREHFGFRGQRRFASRGAADPAAVRRQLTFYYDTAAHLTCRGMLWCDGKWHYLCPW